VPGPADRKTFVLALLGAALAAGLARFPLADASHGLWFVTIATAALVLLGAPILLAEAALGQYRRRNVVDAFGPGAWRGAGLLLVVGAVLAAGLLSVVGGWSARYVVDSFAGSGFDAPERHFRLLSAGPDAVIAQLAVLLVATVIAVRGIGRGLRGSIAACAVVALVLLSVLALWANLQPGSSDGRAALFAFASGGVTASTVVGAVLAGLLPALLGTGITVTLAGNVHDRSLPREATTVVLTLLLGLLAALLFIAPLSSSQHVHLSGGLLSTYSQVPLMFAQVGGTTGGVLAGCFFGALLLACLAGLLALLEVPATWLAEAYPSWTAGRGVAAGGLAAYLVGLPLCFSVARVARFDDFLAWVAAPLLGLLVALHVGWVRPEVLEGFRVGEAGHKLDSGLRPILRFVVPPALAVLLLAGTMGWLRAVGWAHGSGGLWALAPWSP
jgi:NSS family neurotransmitter:Na+ symporter